MKKIGPASLSIPPVSFLLAATLPPSQAVISQASSVQEEIFLLESLINFRSACTES
jgi:hypothetical protein